MFAERTVTITLLQDQPGFMWGHLKNGKGTWGDAELLLGHNQESQVP